MNLSPSPSWCSLCTLTILIAAPSIALAQPVDHDNPPAGGRTAKVQLPWYVTAGAIHRVTLKPNTRFWRFEHLSLKSAEAATQLRAWKEDGVDTIEIFAPEEGGNSYDGLDAKNRYALDPQVGTIEDFRRLVCEAHEMRLHVITFQNFGYAAIDAPQFERAEDDVRAGRSTREAKMFYWSDRRDAPPPVGGNSYFLVHPTLPGYDADKVEFWQHSNRAGRFYWTRWPGKDPKGETTHLPQYNWTSSAWPSEAGKVVDFWMKTGLDGMVVDAVNWYPGFDWKKNTVLIGALRGYSKAKLMLPEGGGAFHTDDPTGWIRDGAWTGLYDYGLDLPWEKDNRPMLQSINLGDPALFEQALRTYHDRVVAAGGILIQPVLDFKDPGKQRLAEGLLATSGDMVCYCGFVNDPVRPAPGVSSLLKLKAKHPALYQNSARRRIPTNQDKSIYATLRDAADESERMLVVFNFSSATIAAQVDAGAINGGEYQDLESGERVESHGGSVSLDLPGHGHRILLVGKSVLTSDRSKKVLRNED